MWPKWDSEEILWNQAKIKEVYDSEPRILKKLGKEQNESPKGRKLKLLKLKWTLME